MRGHLVGEGRCHMDPSTVPCEVARVEVAVAVADLEIGATGGHSNQNFICATDRLCPLMAVSHRYSG